MSHEELTPDSVRAGRSDDHAYGFMESEGSVRISAVPVGSRGVSAVVPLHVVSDDDKASARFKSVPPPPAAAPSSSGMVATVKAIEAASKAATTRTITATNSNVRFALVALVVFAVFAVFAVMMFAVLHSAIDT